MSKLTPEQKLILRLRKFPDKGVLLYCVMDADGRPRSVVVIGDGKEEILQNDKSIEEKENDKNIINKSITS